MASVFSAFFLSNAINVIHNCSDCAYLHLLEFTDWQLMLFMSLTLFFSEYSILPLHVVSFVLSLSIVNDRSH